MLQHIRIKDFAIIDNLMIDFEDSMTVLTGETGAGKSIIIDAIGLLFGERASSEMIKHGSKKSVIEGLFYVENTNIIKLFEDNGIEVTDNQVIIYREISLNKSLARVNGQLVTLQLLVTFANLYADIHVQHDTQRIITPKNYSNLIDTFNADMIKPILLDYQKSLVKYKDSLKDYKAIITDKQTVVARFEMLNFYNKEISELDLTENEDELLTEQRNKLSNYNKIHQNLTDAHDNLSNSKFNLDSIYEASVSLKKIVEYLPEVEEASKNIESAYYTLDDALGTLKQQLNGLEFNPSLLNKIESRLYAINTLKRKLVLDSVNEIIEYHEKIKREISEFGDIDSLVEKKKVEVLSAHKVLEVKANALMDARMKIAKVIEESLLLELSDLQLPNVTFKIDIAKSEFTDEDALKGISAYKNNGAEKIEFLLSTNKGMPVKPLLKVASGGEMSRIMLALKKILLAKQNLSLIVFDEIDTGVSGEVAKKIANKMSDISKSIQVLCVSHLPQVVAAADNHLHITKDVVGDNTSTNVNVLSSDERVTEIARMIGGDTITEVSVAHAKELLSL